MPESSDSTTCRCHEHGHEHTSCVCPQAHVVIAMLFSNVLCKTCTEDATLCNAAFADWKPGCIILPRCEGRCVPYTCKWTDRWMGITCNSNTEQSTRHSSSPHAYWNHSRAEEARELVRKCGRTALTKCLPWMWSPRRRTCNMTSMVSLTASSCISTTRPS